MPNLPKAKRSLALVAAFLTTLCLAAQIKVNYRDGDFTLSGFNTFNATLENGGVQFSGDGVPVSIEITSSGVVVTGKSAQGTTQKDASGNYYLKEAVINGDAHLSVDSQKAYEYASRRKDSTQKPNGVTKTDITSDQIRYAGDAGTGRIDFPGAMNIDSTSTGSEVAKDQTKTDFTHTLHLTGANGFVTMLVTSAPATNPLRTGDISGPVTYSGKSQTISKGITQETTFDGKADHMKFDFTQDPRTITLTGNVTLSSKGPAASGDISADTVVVTVDANLNPVKIDISGSPTKTTMREVAKP